MIKNAVSDIQTTNIWGLTHKILYYTWNECIYEDHCNSEKFPKCKKKEKY